MKLTNFKFYRNLFNRKTFLKVNGAWIYEENYKTGKVSDVDGQWNTQAFCDCGNELVHSKSFIQERRAKNHFVFDYNCSYCGKEQYFNPDLVPGLFFSDKNGNPL